MTRLLPLTTLVLAFGAATSYAAVPAAEPPAYSSSAPASTPLAPCPTGDCKGSCNCVKQGECAPGTCPEKAAPLPFDPFYSVIPVWAGSAGGSGVVVASEGGKSLIVTNQHVIDGGGAISVGPLNGARTPGQLLGTAPDADLALILVNATYPAVELAEVLPAAGERVRLLGYPYNGHEKLCEKYGQADGHRHGTGTFDFDAVGFEPISGDSGGGLFDTTGCLIAINWGKPRNGVPVCHAAGSGPLRSLIKNLAGHLFPRRHAALNADPARTATAAAEATAKKAGKPYDYEAAWKTAKSIKCPLVVFVDCDKQVVPGCVCVAAAAPGPSGWWKKGDVIVVWQSGKDRVGVKAAESTPAGVARQLIAQKAPCPARLIELLLKAQAPQTAPCGPNGCPQPQGFFIPANPFGASPCGPGGCPAPARRR